MNKEVKINFRVSAYEKKLLLSKVRRAKVRFSDFYRKAVFDKEIRYIEGLSEFAYQLYKIGNNLNQITIAAHQGRDISPTLPAMQMRVYETLDRIDRTIGGDGHSDSQTD